MLRKICHLVSASLAKVLNASILILFTLGAILLLKLEITTLRQSILEQMSANLETAITALGLVLQGTQLNDDKVLAETIVNAMFDGEYTGARCNGIGAAKPSAALGEGVGQLLHELRITIRPERHLFTDLVQ